MKIALKTRIFGQTMAPMIFALLTSVLLSCESGENSQPATQVDSETRSVTALQKPITPTIVEAASYALPVWREYREQKPVLVLFSNDPFLKTTPENIENDVLNLLADGSDNDLKAELDLLAGNPLLKQDMAVTAAIKASLFAEVVWVIASEDFNDISSEVMQAKLHRYGATTAAEPFNLIKSAISFKGRLYGTPVQIVHLDDLPQLDNKVVLHVDVTYFAASYRDEESTPLRPIVTKMLSTIREQQWPLLAVTLSQDNLIGNRPLISRYFGPMMSEFFTDPEALDAKLSEEQVNRRRILYLKDFKDSESGEFAKTKQLYDAALAESPEDPLLHYGLYRLYRSVDKQQAALDSLGKAVNLDPIFGIEYQKLAENAEKDEDLLLAVTMLESATLALPESVFIRLQLAETALDAGLAERAVTLIDGLRQESWSTVYYSHIPDLLASLQNRANSMLEKPGTE